ncbi:MULTISPECIES: acetate--CoA ligase [Halorubrum]|uniref:Acetate--CoA ligase n=1 Tax=Halorubrum ezzemoulense TaxID=337243 RepID=A0A256IWP3_HALEZ|nr:MULTISPECIES: acetate--CoA ligase [Halorubrum]MDB2262793.1 acetate--CoA ligase [Halorubrum ezzemoulense]MDB2271264.1 acetate--CoA ligase [Halorubrum ezzemoulense]MDB2281629.1 acetate--CoA ligase [Halorubrum ezzemoulense]MDB9253607.1 acetate--CoA ligase [Halorubrum ezzemoulense]MDB9254483.1 acetate--CoA ligase [Halorubrum ezzemoulense]
MDDSGGGGRLTDGDEDVVPPPADFLERAAADDPGVYERFEREGPDAWRAAADLLTWDREYETVLDDSEPPFYEWFPDGRLNAAANCVDRHLDDRRNQLAIRWFGKRGERRSYTYLDLHREVNAVAAGLRDLGVEEDDVVTLYLPMVPELPIAMLACARIGAPHNVVFAGLSAEALATRIDAADSEYLITCDGYYRREDAFNQKSKADNARIRAESELSAAVVVDRLGDELAVSLGDDEHEYGALVDAHDGETVEPVARDATDLLFVMYTSGTTGRPKGVEHATGGYLAHVAWTTRKVLDVRPDDTYWCAADIGWITGHSYGVYGPLATGTTTVLYEGSPDYPDRDRVWDLIERNAVSVFYTSPTAIRSFMKWGAEYPESHDLSSIRLLGTVGESITPKAWRWYREHVGGGDAPVVDTWWQTETGAIALATLPGITPMKPGKVGPPLPGIDARVVDEDGEPVDPGESGYLALASPWPGMLRGLREGDERYLREYWLRGEDGWRYRTGDGATVDEDGYVTILGRVDDVINVRAQRFNTGELEAAIVDADGVTEAAVVGDGDGRIVAYVTTKSGVEPDEGLRDAVADRLAGAVGDVARPDRIVFTPELPKTRSGKIMRRLLEDIARGEEFGDVSALRNPEVVGEIESTVRDENSRP